MMEEARVQLGIRGLHGLVETTRRRYSAIVGPVEVAVVVILVLGVVISRSNCAYFDPLDGEAAIVAIHILLIQEQ
jgi:hypothetical protein